MVKRFPIAGLGIKEMPGGWNDYVLASDYDALAAELAESKARELSLCNSLDASDIEYDKMDMAHEKRIAALEAALGALIRAYDCGGSWFSNDIESARQFLTAQETKGDGGGG